MMINMVEWQFDVVLDGLINGDLITYRICMGLHGITIRCHQTWLAGKSPV